MQFDFRNFIAPHVMASFNSDRYGFLHEAAIPRVCLLESAMEAENRAQGGSFKQKCATLSQVQAMQNISAQSWAGVAGTVSPVRTVDFAFGAIKFIRPNFPSESTKPKKVFKIIKDLLPVEIETDIDQLDIDVKTQEDLRKFMNICLQRMEDKVVSGRSQLAASKNGHSTFYGGLFNNSSERPAKAVVTAPSASVAAVSTSSDFVYTCKFGICHYCRDQGKQGADADHTHRDCPLGSP